MGEREEYDMQIRLSAGRRERERERDSYFPQGDEGRTECDYTCMSIFECQTEAL